MTEINAATPPAVLLLYGGGLDSTILWADSRSHNIPVHILHFNYGQKAAALEQAALSKYSDLLGAESTRIFKLNLGDLIQANIMDGAPLADEPKSNVLEGRNSIFLTLAGAYAVQLGVRHIIVGYHMEPEERPFPDATQLFLDHMNFLYTTGWRPGVQPHVFAPFYKMTRYQIYKRGYELNPKLLDAHTCYENVVGGCGKCAHCVQRHSMFVQLTNELEAKQ